MEQELKEKIEANPATKELIEEVLSFILPGDESVGSDGEEWSEGYEAGKSETLGYINAQMGSLGL